MRGALSKFVWLMSVSRTRKNFSASMCVSRSDWRNAIPVRMISGVALLGHCLLHTTVVRKLHEGDLPYDY
jgi:hypothetical protein